MHDFSFRAENYTLVDMHAVDQYKASPQEWTCTRAEAMIACRHEKSTAATNGDGLSR
jgi:hypothetical protein